MLKVHTYTIVLVIQGLIEKRKACLFLWKNTTLRYLDDVDYVDVGAQLRHSNKGKIKSTILKSLY